MGSSDFRFKQFSIAQDRCAMKVGTDGVLLGAWADIAGAERILDIGTGTGLIALICAQRNHSADIHAIEIDAAAAQQAITNITDSKYHESIQLEQVSLQDYTPSVRFDTIICNPPFFNAGTRSPNAERQQARHSDALTIADLLSHSARLITEQGELHIVLPIDREGELMESCADYGWHLSRIVVVHPNPTKPAKRILVTLGRSPKTISRDSLRIENEVRFDYTEEYIAFCKPFYLKMTND